MITYLCDLKSGDVIDEYPFQIDQALERRLKDYRTGDFTLPVLDENTPTTWREDVIPWRTMIVACDDDDRIIWGGVPDDLDTTTQPVVTIPCVTLEKYLDRRYTPDGEFAKDDQTSVIARALAEHCGDYIFGVGLDYDTPASGVPRDRSYHDDEDARILKRMQQLSNVINGFEWTINIEWRDDDHTGIRKVFRTGYPTLGVVTEEPELVFEVTAGVPGPISEFAHSEQWGEGNAATHVRAVGDGEGEDKPISKPVVDTFREANGWPRLEERRTQQGVIEQSTLDAYADGMAVDLFGGQTVLEFDAIIAEWPGPADINLGDSARVTIDTDQLVLDEVWRIIGYKINPKAGTWTPQIARIGEQEIEDAT